MYETWTIKPTNENQPDLARGKHHREHPTGLTEIAFLLERRNLNDQYLQKLRGTEPSLLRGLANAGGVLQSVSFARSRHAGRCSILDRAYLLS